MTYFVIQNVTKDKECQGDYLWAPESNTNGLKKHYWDRVGELETGDIVFTYADGYINGLKVAMAKPKKSIKPEGYKEGWSNEGYKVQLSKSLYEIKIDVKEHVEEFAKYNKGKHQPFDKNGNINRGYLFDVNKELKEYLFSLI